MCTTTERNNYHMLERIHVPQTTLFSLLTWINPLPMFQHCKRCNHPSTDRHMNPVIVMILLWHAQFKINVYEWLICLKIHLKRVKVNKGAERCSAACRRKNSNSFCNGLVGYNSLFWEFAPMTFWLSCILVHSMPTSPSSSILTCPFYSLSFWNFNKVMKVNFKQSSEVVPWPI